jgi:hypothetical protein
MSTARWEAARTTAHSNTLCAHTSRAHVQNSAGVCACVCVCACVRACVCVCAPLLKPHTYLMPTLWRWSAARTARSCMFSTILRRCARSSESCRCGKKNEKKKQQVRKEGGEKWSEASESFDAIDDGGSGGGGGGGDVVWLWWASTRTTTSGGAATILPTLRVAAQRSVARRVGHSGYSCVARRTHSSAVYEPHAIHKLGSVLIPRQNSQMRWTANLTSKKCGEKQKL